MDLFKKTITTWELNGRRVAAGTPGAVKIVTKSAKWYGKLNGKQIALSESKETSHRMFRKLASDAELRAVGLVDPYEQHRDKPISIHLDDFRVALVSKGNTAKHVTGTLNRVEAVVKGCGFVKLDDLEEGKVSSWLTEQRKPKPMVELPPGERFTPSQAAAILGITLSGVQKLAQRHSLPASGTGKARRLHRQALEMMAERMAQGKSPETVNHYVRALRSFGSFLERTDRMRRNPFKGLSLLNNQVDIRHARRELTADEIRRLLEGTRQSNREFRGLTGEDRPVSTLLP